MIFVRGTGYAEKCCSVTTKINKNKKKKLPSYPQRDVGYSPAATNLSMLAFTPGASSL